MPIFLRANFSYGYLANAMGTGDTSITVQSGSNLPIATGSLSAGTMSGTITVTQVS
jgi:hypothetical protein